MRDNGYLSDKDIEDLISQVEHEGLESAPRGLKAEIMWNAKAIREEELKCKKREFHIYSIKIALGAAAAIAILATVPSRSTDRSWTEPDSFEQSAEAQSIRTDAIKDKIGNKVETYRNDIKQSLFGKVKG